MNSADIAAAIENFEYEQVAAIRAAVDARMETLKAETMAKAQAMGLACHDNNGKPKRKRRANVHKEPEATEST